MIFRYFLIIFLITIFFMGKILWPFLSILVLAFVLTGTFYPVFRFFSRKMRPALSSLITCTIIFLVVFVPLVFLVGALSKEAFGLYLMGTSATIGQDFKELLQDNQIIERIEGLLANYNIKLEAEHLNNGLSELWRSVGMFLYEQVSAIASNILKFVVNFAFMLLVIFFLLIDGKKLIAFLIELSPLPDDQDRKLMGKFHEMATVVLIVNGISGVVQGVLGGLVFAIFGLSSPFLWGSIMAILAFFPIVGVAIVFIPASVFLFLKGRIAAGIFFIIFYLVISSVIEYVLKPKLVGNKVRIHTLLVFIAVLGGLKVFGILGIIYGPLVITAFLTLTDIYRSSYETQIWKA
ncbi:MAG: AI-2E family transporter [Desulfobacterales bacterium]|nr:AI-2E family transporter [Desulfobacterales bacterium]